MLLDHGMAFVYISAVIIFTDVSKPFLKMKKIKSIQTDLNFPINSLSLASLQSPNGQDQADRTPSALHDARPAAEEGARRGEDPESAREAKGQRACDGRQSFEGCSHGASRHAKRLCDASDVGDCRFG